MDGWLEADNCQSRSEFMDKALRFYMGYLGTEDNTTYISQAILTAIQGTMDLNNHRLQKILFKCAVELNMLCHTIAAHFRADPIHTRELRAYAVDETSGDIRSPSATATDPTAKKSARQRPSKSRPVFPSAASGSMSPTLPKSWSAASRPATPRMAR